MVILEGYMACPSMYNTCIAHVYIGIHIELYCWQWHRVINRFLRNKSIYLGMKWFTLREKTCLWMSSSEYKCFLGMLQERWNCVIKPDHDRQEKGSWAVRALPVLVGSVPGWPSALDSSCSSVRVSSSILDRKDQLWTGLKGGSKPHQLLHQAVS